MPPSPKRDYSQWFPDAIFSPAPGALTPQAREMLRLGQDLDHLFAYVVAGAENVAGRGEFGELTASPTFYDELAREFIDFATLHPEKAARVLRDVFRMIEMAPSAREDTLRRRRSTERLTA